MAGGPKEREKSRASAPTETFWKPRLTSDQVAPYRTLEGAVAGPGVERPRIRRIDLEGGDVPSVRPRGGRLAGHGVECFSLRLDRCEDESCHERARSGRNTGIPFAQSSRSREYFPSREDDWDFQGRKPRHPGRLSRPRRRFPRPLTDKTPGWETRSTPAIRRARPLFRLRRGLLEEGLRVCFTRGESGHSPRPGCPRLRSSPRADARYPFCSGPSHLPRKTVKNDSCQ